MKALVGTGKPFCMLLPSSVLHTKFVRDSLDMDQARADTRIRGHCVMCHLIDGTAQKNFQQAFPLHGVAKASEPVTLRVPCSPACATVLETRALLGSRGPRRRCPPPAARAHR